MTRLLVYPALALSLGIAVAAQTPPPAASFDVTSVKRTAGAGGPMTMRNSPGNFAAINIPVREVIKMAYQVQDFQLIGAPDWTGVERYDIEGRFDPTAPLAGFDSPPARNAAMVRSLLRDRFGMVAHTETREMPVLALRLARADGRLGPQIKQSAVDCSAMAGPGRGPIEGRGGPIEGRGPIPGRGGPDGRIGGPLEGRIGGPLPPCGSRGGFGQLTSNGMPMAQFARQLSQLTGRQVVERTGLTGGYDIDLKFTPTPDQLPPGPPPPGVELPPIDPNGPSLFAALQEQLGLKLDTERGQVEVVVIDRIERPRET